MKIDSEKLPSIILKARYSKNFTQTNMAEMLKISQKNYGYIETGRCKLDLIKFLIIADSLELNPLEMINSMTSESKWPDISKDLRDEKVKLEEQVKTLTSHNKFLQETIKIMLNKNNDNKDQTDQL